MGENGSGKSTLLRIIVGLLPLDQGSVKINCKYGYCPQEPLVFDGLTMEENITYFGAGYRLSRQAALKRGHDLMERLDCRQCNNEFDQCPQRWNTADSILFWRSSTTPIFCSWTSHIRDSAESPIWIFGNWPEKWQSWDGLRWSSAIWCMTRATFPGYTGWKEERSSMLNTQLLTSLRMQALEYRQRWLLLLIVLVLPSRSLRGELLQCAHRRSAALRGPYTQWFDHNVCRPQGNLAHDNWDRGRHLGCSTVAFFGVVGSLRKDRRLLVCGYRAWQILLARLGLLVGLSVPLALVGTLPYTMISSSLHPIIVWLACFLAALIAAGFGLLIEIPASPHGGAASGDSGDGGGHVVRRRFCPRSLPVPCDAAARDRPSIA